MYISSYNPCDILSISILAINALETTIVKTFLTPTSPAEHTSEYSEENNNFAVRFSKNQKSNLEGAPVVLAATYT